MHVAQLINYYPKYSYLDSILSATGKRKMTIFVDLKGCMQSLYLEWAIRYVIEQSRGTKYVDSSLFSSFLEFISFHKQYAKKRDIELDMIFFFENGRSEYHEQIHPDYKGDRKNKDFFGIDATSIDLFKRVLNKNLVVIEKVGNKLPGVSVVKLDYMEADFMPWYLAKHVIEDYDKAINVIYSVDKDMLQCIDSNTVQFYKHYKVVRVIGPKNVYSHYMKKPLDWEYIDPEFFALYLAVDGDMGDNFKGIKGIGPSKMEVIFPILTEMCGSMEEIAKNIREGNSIFIKDSGTNNKFIDKVVAEENIVVRNLKLASYRLLSEYVNNGYSLVNVKRQKYMIETVNNTEKIENANILYEALGTIGMKSSLQEETASNIFN